LAEAPGFTRAKRVVGLARGKVTGNCVAKSTTRGNWRVEIGGKRIDEKIRGVVLGQGRQQGGPNGEEKWTIKDQRDKKKSWVWSIQERGEKTPKEQEEECGTLEQEKKKAARANEGGEKTKRA